MKTLYRIDTNNTPANPNGQGPGYDMSANWNSLAVNVDNLIGYSVGASWSGSTPTGSLKLQVSNNAFIYENTNNNLDPNAVWTDVPGSTFAVAGNGSYFWNVADVYYRAFRVVYTFTSGTGNATLYIFAKGIQ